MPARTPQQRVCASMGFSLQRIACLCIRLCFVGDYGVAGSANTKAPGSVFHRAVRTIDNKQKYGKVRTFVYYTVNTTLRIEITYACVTSTYG
ncbi:hypothetical protein KSX_48160 [Ktedonospora formicarum]|uniref:Uncharacterized protein n=1 Tax=Ktedonospora formicarum TaxID=2778364 RepID=A0A8J3I695_9CHLR|nr:hypothetical protein KSX_48160 [Ktedonospora formicarum]